MDKKCVLVKRVEFSKWTYYPGDILSYEASSDKYYFIPMYKETMRLEKGVQAEEYSSIAVSKFGCDVTLTIDEQRICMSVRSAKIVAELITKTLNYSDNSSSGCGFDNRP